MMLCNEHPWKKDIVVIITLRSSAFGVLYRHGR